MPSMKTVIIFIFIVIFFQGEDKKKKKKKTKHKIDGKIPSVTRPYHHLWWLGKLYFLQIFFFFFFPRRIGLHNYYAVGRMVPMRNNSYITEQD